MKITKKSIKASEDVALVAVEPVLEDSLETLVKPTVEVAIVCPYEEAISFIHQAIDCLGAVAKDDPLARESIANLSVVLFDLKC